MSEICTAVYPSQSTTHQKCTVFNPIGLSHILLIQPCCAAAGASVAALLAHLFAFACWNLYLLDLKTKAVFLDADEAGEVKVRNAGRAARKRDDGVGISTVLFYYQNLACRLRGRVNCFRGLNREKEI